MEEKMTPTSNEVDRETDEIMDGLAGNHGFKLGEKLYVFTVTYHYIGRVARITGSVVILEDAEIVMNAGVTQDAVSRIVQGKGKPEVSEKPGMPIRIFLQAVTAVIPLA
jgi:hypothetical protein